MIESLQSPHVARVKALLSSKKDRTESKLFVAEGIQGVREALLIEGEVETLYLTKAGSERLNKSEIDYSGVNVIEISEKVAEAMSDAITSQGIVAICRMAIQSNETISTLAASHVIYLHEIQDPGNAGTILRTADAMGISAVVTSPGIAEKWDLYIDGFELATGYSELVDPVIQRERLVEQAKLAAKGDLEAMQVDEDFLRAMEFGMPPMGGMGMGVDRLLMALTGLGIRETILFPLVKLED